MKLVKPKFIIEDYLTKVVGNQILKKLEGIGRTCYKSEEKITSDSAKKFISNLIKRGHTSVLEHHSISVRIITSRILSQQWTRHRLLDIDQEGWETHLAVSQESTRFCNYKGGVTFIIPPWIDLPEGEINEGTIETPVELIKALSEDSPRGCWLCAMDYAETFYKELLDHGWNPEQARGVLPFDLKTEFVCTANLTEWRYILKIRTKKSVDPGMKIITIPLLKKFQELIPVVFDDIYNEIFH